MNSAAVAVVRASVRIITYHALTRFPLPSKTSFSL